MIFVREKTLSIGNKVWGSIGMCGILGVVISVIGFSGIQAFGQEAILENGTVLTRVTPPEFWATEGSISVLDASTQTFTAVGTNVTVPATVDGEVVAIGDTVATTPLVVSTAPLIEVPEITASTFGQLLDTSASATAVRSIFSSDTVNAATDQMKANYFARVKYAYSKHQTSLPLNFLELAGITPAGNTYPTFTGGTLKSAGHVYADIAGKRYNIPDAEFVVELSENVIGGVVSSIAPGDGVNNPTSFVIGDLLLIMNPDPRFDSSVFGALETGVPLSVFEAEGLGKNVSAGGHMVGAHVFFVQALNTSLLDTTLGPFVLTERFQFDNAGNEIRFRGQVSERNEGTEDELYMEVTISDDPTGVADPRVYQVDLLPPEVTGNPGGVFGFRSRDELTVADVTALTVTLYYKRQSTSVLPGQPGFHLQDEIAFTETIFRVDVE